MQKQIEQLIEFHNAFGLPVRNTPDPFNDSGEAAALNRMRHRLMKEEIDEWLDAALWNDDSDKRAKELADILYTVFGTVITEGYQDVIERVFDQVHESNMTKLGEDGKPVYREDGKVTKGPNYKAPDLGWLVKRD